LCSLIWRLPLSKQAPENQVLVLGQACKMLHLAAFCYMMHKSKNKQINVLLQRAVKSYYGGRIEKCFSAVEGLMDSDLDADSRLKLKKRCLSCWSGSCSVSTR
jgi:hypothetical protein